MLNESQPAPRMPLSPSLEHDTQTPHMDPRHHGLNNISGGEQRGVGLRLSGASGHNRHYKLALHSNLLPYASRYGPACNRAYGMGSIRKLGTDANVEKRDLI